jgi:hypothetical protein
MDSPLFRCDIPECASIRGIYRNPSSKIYSEYHKQHDMLRLENLHYIPSVSAKKKKQ